MHTKEHQFYDKLGKKCVENGVTIDLYFGLNQTHESIDLATLNKVV